MNRREMLAGLVASAAAVDVAATASVIEAEPTPLLLVLKLSHHLSTDAMCKIRSSWELFRERNPGMPPCIILEPGVTLEAVVDPREVKS